MNETSLNCCILPFLSFPSSLAHCFSFYAQCTNSKGIVQSHRLGVMFVLMRMVTSSLSSLAFTGLQLVRCHHKVLVKLLPPLFHSGRSHSIFSNSVCCLWLREKRHGRAVHTTQTCTHSYSSGLTAWLIFELILSSFPRFLHLGDPLRTVA